MSWLFCHLSNTISNAACQMAEGKAQADLEGTWSRESVYMHRNSVYLWQQGHKKVYVGDTSSILPRCLKHMSTWMDDISLL